MSNEDLPKEFDIIILGTGLTTTITAAAFSRIGLKVLHLDRNDYYGGLFANFNLDAIEVWKQKNIDLNKGGRESDSAAKNKDPIPDGVKCIDLPQERAQAFNLSSSFHVRERTPEEDEAAKKLQTPFKPFFPLPKAAEPVSDSNKTSEELDASKSSDGQDEESANQSRLQDKSETYDSQSVITDNQKNSDAEDVENKETATESVKDKSVGEESVQSSEKESALARLGDDKAFNEEAKTNSPSDSEQKSESEEVGKVTEERKESSGLEKNNEGLVEEKKKEWTVGDIKDEWRRFCLDLSPRVLFCCGEIIELLIRSDVARYCEFRTVSRVLTVLKDKLEPVPCSRADVFGSKIVSLIEKRLMMKFLQFAADFENHPQEYEGHKNSTFLEFLKFKKLTPNLQHFVQHAIAMVDDSAGTEQGLSKTKKFLQSLGRYGNTAFLFPLYGTGELSQAFARMSAVFGGVYCLMETATHLLADADNKCCGIVTSKGQTINCKYLVAESSYLPQSFTKRISSGKISRGIYITDASISPSSDEDLSLLNFICKNNSSRSVTVLEMPPSACVCPKNLYVVYLTRVSDSDDPEGDLQEVRERLFAPSDCAATEETRPNILWSMHFTLNDWSSVEITDQAVENVLVSSEGGDAEIDLDKCVPEAKRLFHQVCPDEEFLPTPPNPEDIIHVDDTESPVATGGSSEFENGEETSEGNKDIETNSTETPDEENKIEENQDAPQATRSEVEGECNSEKSEVGEEKAGEKCEALSQDNES